MSKYSTTKSITCKLSYHGTNVGIFVLLLLPQQHFTLVKGTCKQWSCSMQFRFTCKSRLWSKDGV